MILRRCVLSLVGMAPLAFTLEDNALAASSDKRPNIVFILADDLGVADLSCYGRRDYRTPNLDRLASEGVRLTQAYANSAVCSATRTALITGRYQNRLPIGLEEPLAGRDVGLPSDHPTLPSLLRARGYRTSLIGKWHLGQLPKFGPLKSGYDEFFGFRAGATDYWTHGLLGHPDLWDGDQLVEREGYITDLLGDRAVSTIERGARDARPFMISLHFNAPHWPWEAPGDKAAAARLAGAKNLEAVADFEGGSLAIYAKIVGRMDYQVGRVLEALKRRGLDRNTIVVFTSDNGGERFSDTWPFSGKKTELLEGGLRIPAIMRWPGHVAAGTASDQVMISMDWLPTLLAAAGGAPDPGYPSDGIDILPLLSAAKPLERTLFWRYLNLSQEACRSGDWKYLKILDNTFLFNVVDDPLERANLKTRQPAIYSNLVDKFAGWDRSMLPLDYDVFTAGFTGAEMADHFGVTQSRNVLRPK